MGPLLFGAEVKIFFSKRRGLLTTFFAPPRPAALRCVAFVVMSLQVLRTEVPAAAPAHAVPARTAAGHGRPAKAGDERVVSQPSGGGCQLALVSRGRSLTDLAWPIDGCKRLPEFYRLSFSGLDIYLA